MHPPVHPGAGITEAILVVCPMETIKVKLINDQMKPNPQYKGLVHGIQTIVAQEGQRSDVGGTAPVPALTDAGEAAVCADWAATGIGGIYKGLTATILKQGTNQGIRFLVFNEIKKVLVGDDVNAKMPWYKTMAAGAIAGAASVLGNNPLDVVKSRMQGLDSKKYKNSLDCFIKIYQENGLLGYGPGARGRVAEAERWVLTRCPPRRMRCRRRRSRRQVLQGLHAALRPRRRRRRDRDDVVRANRCRPGQALLRGGRPPPTCTPHARRTFSGET